MWGICGMCKGIVYFTDLLLPWSNKFQHCYICTAMWAGCSRLPHAVYHKILHVKQYELNLLTPAWQIFAYPLWPKDHFSGSILATQLLLLFTFSICGRSLFNHFRSFLKAFQCEIVRTKIKPCVFNSSVLRCGHYILWLSPHNFV